jgi:large subunit ribosomal protein L4
MAVSIPVIDASGSPAGRREVPDELFGGDVNEAAMHQVVTAQLAAARSGTASTKTRAEVRGGGKKPWRQKGTGRARHGSTRSPIWVGGGTVFGPRPRKHEVRVNKKMKRTALRSALAGKASDGAIRVLDGFDETKTRAAAACLEAAGVHGRVLIVLDPGSAGSLAVDRAFRNLDGAAFSLYGSLSTYDVLVADAIVFTADALDRYVERGSREPAAAGGGA